MSKFTPTTTASSKPIHQRKQFNKDGYEGLIFQPQPGKHSATIIFIHGLGDSADGLEDIITLWGDEFPEVKFILPTAKQMPISVYMGQRANAWYDIKHLADAVEEKDRDPSTGLSESKDFIQSIIIDEIQQGIALCRIILMGFSQGGALTLTTGLQLNLEEEVVKMATKDHRYPNHVAGLLVMSGYLPKKYAFHLQETSRSVPILHVHGAADPLVTVSYAEKTKEFLLQQGVTHYELKLYPGVVHTLSMEMIADAKQFLHQCLNTFVDNEEAIKDFLVPIKHPKDLSMKEIKQLIKDFHLQTKTIGMAEKSEFVQLLLEYYQKEYDWTF